MQVQYLFYLLLFFCRGNDPGKNSVKANNYFPNKEGNYWEYSVYDSSVIREHANFPRRYTVKVSVTGTKMLADNKAASVWKYEFPWGNEIQYCRTDKDSVMFFDEGRGDDTKYILFPSELYIHPFYNGQRWSGKLLWQDSFNVKTSIISGYQKVFKIHRDYSGQQTYYHNDYWFVPNIGFVKKHRYVISLGIRTNELWQLINYHLK